MIIGVVQTPFKDIDEERRMMALELHAHYEDKPVTWLTFCIFLKSVSARV